MAVKLNNWNFRNLELIPAAGSYYAQAMCFVRFDVSRKAVWRVSSLKLEAHIGATSYGEFDIKSTSFPLRAKKDTIKLIGTVLHAELYAGGSNWVQASLDLTLLLANNDGNLVYIGRSVSDFTLRHVI